MGGRAFHLIDIENLVGGGRLRPDEVASACKRYLRIALYSSDDLAIAAVGHSQMSVAAFALPRQVRLVGAGHGPDAADIALLRAVDEAVLLRGFGRLSIGSGDHFFAPLAARMRESGLVVEVVHPKLGLSRELAAACTRISGSMPPVLLRVAA